ncbi:hypothetical protein [Nonomuraea sp. NPDC049684]|uniref:hypothetical protein n=1 Tax=Nonomuraea sp. NPDC049684 TaxID=3364356 RepID=UPI0037B2E0B4
MEVLNFDLASANASGGDFQQPSSTVFPTCAIKSDHFRAGGQERVGDEVVDELWSFRFYRRMVSGSRWLVSKGPLSGCEGLVDDTNRDLHAGGDGADGFPARAAGEDRGALVVVDHRGAAADPADPVKIVYSRVSTASQSLLRQRHILTEAGLLVRTEGVAEGFRPAPGVLLFEDPATTSKIPALDRPAFGTIAAKAHPGDTLTVSELFRL